MGKATFGVVIDRSPVYAGSTLTGQVYADVQQEIRGSSLTSTYQEALEPLPRIPANRARSWPLALPIEKSVLSHGPFLSQVEFLGQESTKVGYTTTRTVRNSDGSSHTVSEKHYAYGSRRIVQAQLPVHQLDLHTQGKVQPGRYVVPFQIELPPSLPSSLYHSNIDGYVKIEYQVKAVLQGSGVLFNYSAEQAVAVLSAPPAPTTNLVPYCGEPSVSPVNFCCCWNRGAMVLGVWTDTTLLAKGSSALLRVACRNQSSVAAKEVRAELTERLQWHASGHTATSVNTLASTSFGTASMTMVGMEPRSPEVLRQSRADSNLRRNLAQSDLAGIMDELKSGSHQQPLAVPVHARPTYVGSLVAIRHEIRVCVSVDGCCLSEPTVVIPITVLEPRPGAAPLMPPPTIAGAPPNYQAIAPSAPPAELDGEVDIALPELPAEFSASSAGVVYTNAISVGSQDAALGGLAGGGPTEDEIVVPASSTGDDVDGAPPGLNKLISDMKASIAGEDIVDRKLADPAWSAYFEAMSPSDYGAVVKAVQLSLQQMGVAESVAARISQFSCDHVKAAVLNATSLNRASMVESLLPCAADVAERSGIVLAVLTDWEKDLTKSVFARVAAGSGGNP